MSHLFLIPALALALAAPVSAADAAQRRAPGEPGRLAGPRPVDTCTVGVRALDALGAARSARAVSASQAPVVALIGSLLHDRAGQKPLVFDVFNPSGQRYQVLEARPRQATIVSTRSGLSRRTRVRVHEARLAVAGSSIAWTSMYGDWRVVPRLQGADEPCGRPVTFTIAP